MEKRLTLEEFILFINLRQIVFSSFSTRHHSSYLSFHAKGYLPVFELGIGIIFTGSYDGNFVTFSYQVDMQDIRILPSHNVFNNLIEELNRFNSQKRGSNSNNNI